MDWFSFLEGWFRVLFFDLGFVESCFTVFSQNCFRAWLWVWFRVYSRHVHGFSRVGLVKWFSVFRVI